MKNSFLVVLLGALLLLSCNQHEPVNYEGGEPPRVMMSAPPALHKPVMKVARNEIVERKLIKNGEITFTTKDIAETRKLIEKVCKDFEAYISSDEQQKMDDNINFVQVIRIPAARFDAFLKTIEGLGERIEYRNVTTSDVTEEFIDTEARLKTKRELEVRYHQLLGKASKIEDMLAIEEQIAKVRTEIEAMQGRLNFLTNQVGYSTLRVSYNQQLVADYGFGSQVVSSFVTGWNGFLVFFVALVSSWPVILLLVIALWFVRRSLKKVSFAKVPVTEKS